MAADPPTGPRPAGGPAPPAAAGPPDWTIERASVSAAGARTRNEDRLAERRCADGRHHVLVLADGAGGHADGARAAALAVAAALDALDAGVDIADGARLAQAVMRAHATVAAAQRERATPQGLDEQQATMHTTLVLLVVDVALGAARWAHVGDSRLYRLRAGGAEALTRDDTLAQRLADAGTPLPEGAASRTPLLAALGGSTPPIPHVPPRQVALQDGDVFLLCSDGWWDALAPRGIGAAPPRATALQAWLDREAEVIARRAQPRQDNYSALACRVQAPTCDADLPTVVAFAAGGDLPTLPGR